MPDHEPFTIEHFTEWASELVLDSGEQWVLEDFQLAFVADVLEGYPEVWLVVPEGNGKTTLVAGFALYRCKFERRANIPVGAAAREQAEEVYRQAEIFVTETPGMAKEFRCYEGYRKIVCHETRGKIQVKAADERTGDGGIPTMYVLDELHRHRNLALYRTWRGKLTKRQAQIIAISTAGAPNSEFEEARERILNEATDTKRKGAHIRAEADGLVLHDWAVRDREKVEDMKVVAKANPLEALKPDVLAAKRASKTMTMAHWLRMNCNIAAREEGQAVTAEEWDRLREDDLVPDRKVWSIGWMDLGWEIDTTAIGVLVWESIERRVIAGVRVFTPPVDEADVVAGLVSLQLEFDPVGWVYDPNAGGQQMAQLLDKGEHPGQEGIEFNFFTHSQDNAPMALAATRFHEALRKKWFVHDGHKELKRHVLNAVRRSLGGEKWKYDRPNVAKGRRRAEFPIDALTGVLMGNSVAVAEHESQPSEVVFL